MFKLYALAVLVLLMSAWWLHNRTLNMVLVSVVALSVIQSVFYVETRHRLLAEPLLMIALAVLAELVGRWQVRSRLAQ